VSRQLGTLSVDSHRDHQDGPVARKEKEPERDRGEHNEVYYDPYDFEIDADPYPVWRRMRDTAPLYYNEKYDFFAVSRFEDVDAACSTGRPTDRARVRFSSSSRPISTSRRASSCSRIRLSTTYTED
jgi:hypothetical protein